MMMNFKVIDKDTVEFDCEKYCRIQPHISLVQLRHLDLINYVHVRVFTDRWLPSSEELGYNSEPWGRWQYQQANRNNNNVDLIDKITTNVSGYIFLLVNSRFDPYESCEGMYSNKDVTDTLSRLSTDRLTNPIIIKIPVEFNTKLFPSWFRWFSAVKKYKIGSPMPHAFLKTHTAGIDNQQHNSLVFYRNDIGNRFIKWLEDTKTKIL